MYSYFKGIVEEKYEDRIVIDVNGIGYNIIVPLGYGYRIPDEGSEAKIYTYTSVREDALCLYGFMTRDELNIFKMLITVSGIGPKGGQAILSEMSVDELKEAIIMENASRISKAQGVGKKTAERVILELKDKITAFNIDTINGLNISAPAVNDGKLSEDEKDAIEALTALGYGQKEAKEAVVKAYAEGATDSNKLLKAALKYM